MTPRQLYDSELDLISDVISWICRRHAMDPGESEDFGSSVHIRLLENDCAVLAKFQGKAKLRTYLTTVINNQYKDYLIAKNSKWRPSAKAKRLGWVAVALEIQLSRRGHSIHDAIAIVRQDGGVSESADELEELAAQLPVRIRPTFAGESEVERLEADTPADAEALKEDVRPSADRIYAILGEEMGELDRQDCLILKMRFLEGQKVVRIAKVLGLEAKKLYPRIVRSLKQLEANLGSRGVSREDVREVLGWGHELDSELDLDAT